jgi:hypothetical protein
MDSKRPAKFTEPLVLGISPSGKCFVYIEGLSLPGLQLCKLESLDLGNLLAVPQPVVEQNARASCVAVSHDGRKALTGGRSADVALRLWDLERGVAKEVGVPNEGIECLALSRDLRYALAGASDKTIRVWDLTSASELGTLTGHTGPITSVAFSPDGRHALSGSHDNTMRLWDLKTRRELAQFKGHTDVVQSVAFSSDGLLALSGSADKSVSLWRIRRLLGVSSRDEGASTSAGRKAQYLSDMEEFDVEVSEGRFAKQGNLGYSAGGSDKIKVNGKESPKGLSMCPDAGTHARVRYKLGKSATTFLASVALNDSAGAPGRPAGEGKIDTPVTFEVLGDGKVLWKSKTVDVARKVQQCKVDVTGVNILELRVDCPGSHVNAHTVWLEPRVLLK